MNAYGIDNKDNNQDDLQEISGIGPDFERDLHQAGVNSFAQLAKFRDAQHLHKALKEAEIEIPLWRIEKNDWINQARKKVKNKKIVPTVEETVVKKHDPNQAISTGKSWKEQAAFMVSFDRYISEEGEESWRTRVYKGENGDEIKFEGTNPLAWTQWMSEQAKLPASETRIDETNDAGHSDPELVITHIPTAEIGKQLKITDFQITSPSTAAPQRELNAQIQFQLLGSEIEAWTEEKPPYRLELYLLDSESKMTYLVASIQRQLEPGILEYELEQTIPIPSSPARYELFVMLLSLPPTEMMASHHGPMINVVPHPVRAL
jgi:hypothetical protein